MSGMIFRGYIAITNSVKLKALEDKMVCLHINNQYHENRGGAERGRNTCPPRGWGMSGTRTALGDWLAASSPSSVSYSWCNYCSCLQPTGHRTRPRLRGVL